MDNLLRFILVSAHFTRHSFHRMWKNLVFKESCNLSCFCKVLIGEMIVRVSRCLYNAQSIFQHYEARQCHMDTFQLFVFFFLPRNGAIPSDNWREISQKRLELTGLATDESLSNFVRSCREPKEMSALEIYFWGNGYAWN